LDVSSNTALKQLYCQNNSLTSLDISHNPELTYLDCTDNQITTLDIRANTKLKNYSCDSETEVVTATLETPVLAGITSTASGVKVTWNASDGATNYRVFRKTSGGSWKKIGDTASTSYTDTTAKSGTTYIYTVRCVTTDGSLYTSSYDKTGLSITYIAAPVLSDVKNTSAGVKITWTASTGAEKYRVYRKTPGGSWKRIANTSSTSYTDKTAVSGTTYVYTVRCINSSGSATTSGYDETGLTITYIAAPALSAVSNAAGGVKITWEASTGAAQYRVFRKTSGGSWKKIGDTTSTSYTDTSAKSGTTYTYTVRCLNSAGTSYTSGFDSTGLGIKYLSCGTISKLTNTSTGIKVTWNKVTGASGYYVYRKTSSGTYKKIKTVTGESTVTYTDTAVKDKNGTTYLYAVKAYSGNTASAYKSQTTVRLTTPTLSGVMNSAAGSVTVQWAAVENVTGYQIMYSTSSDFGTYSTAKVSDASSVSKVISGLTKGKTYYVRIRTYKKVSGTTYSSGWTSKKSIKISK
ncbi:MAG: hypothetical protein LUF78_07835, partial [Clostridiales bacterium]|nr:hypothetical protein [Clostridiales bacterium]